MYKAKRVLMLLAVLIFSASSLIAQNSADGIEEVTISIKSGLSIANDAGDLAFDDVIVVGETGTATLTPDGGVRFRVDGHSSGNVTVSFGDATITNDDGDELTFAPEVAYTGLSTTYSNNIIGSGDGVSMVDGTIYLWVGGDIDYDASTPAGDYDGDFTLTVAY